MSAQQQERETSNIVHIAQQVAEGELPSNKEIKKELDPLKEHLAHAEHQAQGLPKAEAFHQTKELVEAVEKTLDTKNTGNRIQKLAAAATKVAERTALPTAAGGQILDETKEFVATLKDLAMSVVNSKDFRKALTDFFEILKDVTQIEEEKIGVSEKAEKGYNEGKPIEAAQEIINKASDVVKNLPDEIPEEQKKKLRENLKKLLTSLKQDADTSHAFRKFLRLISLIQAEVSAHLAAAHIDKDVREVEELAVDLIDSFLQGKSIHQLVDRVKAVVEKIQSDEDLSKLLQQARDFIETAFQNPELIDSDKFYDEADKLYERSRKLTKKYQKDRTINKVVDEAQELLRTFKSDEQLTELQYRAGKVVDSLTYTDLKGTSHLDYDIIGAMRKELVPYLIDRIKEVPVPGFRLENEDFEYLVVKDLYCKLGDILPDKIRIQAKNDTDITINDMEAPVQSESVIKFYMEGLRPEFKDFYFEFKRKGIVNIKDEGRANLAITGKGVNVFIEFQLELDQNNHTVLGKHKVEVKTDGVDIDIVEADHKVLLNVVSSLWSGQIKKGFEASLRKRFDEMGGDWAAYLNKRVLTTLPTLRDVAQTITTAAVPPLQVLGETTVKATAGATTVTSS